MKRSTPLWPQLLAALGVSVAVGVIAARIDLYETLHETTRRWENLQLDELPYALFAFVICLLVMLARRQRQLGREMAARDASDAALQAAHARNRELARQNIVALEAERKYLARELHDELGQYLNAIKLDAVRLEGDAATRIVAHADHVHRAVSDLIRRLRPVGLDELGLGAALEHCVSRWRQTVPTVEFELELDGTLEGLEDATNLAVFRLIQEGLTNAARHADAARVEVSVRGPAQADGSGFVEVDVTDDGRGFETASTPPGFGLAGMRERIELLGGSLAVDSEPGAGTCLRARLPARAGGGPR